MGLIIDNCCYTYGIKAGFLASASVKPVRAALSSGSLTTAVPITPEYGILAPAIFLAATRPAILAVEPIGDQAGSFVSLLITVAQSPTA